MAQYIHCKKCLTSSSDYVLGQACQTPGCDGVIEVAPEFKDLVDDLPEPFLCPRRVESPLGAQLGGSCDYWQKFKSNGNRVCSFCGSLHWEDMLALVHAAASCEADASYGSAVEIEPSDKGYKVYVHQPGVRNAHEGGIKFYMQHVPRDANGKMIVSEEQQKEYGAAVRASHHRFQLNLKRLYPTQNQEWVQ